MLVLGASPDKGGPGPIVTALSRHLGSLPVPPAVVPGALPKERLGQVWQRRLKERNRMHPFATGGIRTGAAGKGKSRLMSCGT